MTSILFRFKKNQEKKTRLNWSLKVHCTLVLERKKRSFRFYYNQSNLTVASLLFGRWYGADVELMCSWKKSWLIIIMNGWMDKWMNRQINEWMNRHMQLFKQIKWGRSHGMMNRQTFIHVGLRWFVSWWDDAECEMYVQISAGQCHLAIT